MSVSTEHLVLTCEHGGNRVPAPLRACFRDAAAVLESHRGWDPGALVLARHLSRALSAPLVFHTISRLVVDVNRSLHHARVFSEYTRGLATGVKTAVAARHYHPYRSAVEALVLQTQRRCGMTLHLAVHSFTPQLDGAHRNADVGILYDPRRAAEVRFAQALRAAMQDRLPGLRVRYNYPYRGSADGFTTHLRRLHPGDAYTGIELEVNQALVQGRRTHWQATRANIAAAIEDALAYGS